MKIKILLILSIVLFFGCTGDKNFKIGFTPSGLPVTIAISGDGVPSINFNNEIRLPIGVFSIGREDFMQNHRTYVELISRNDNKKYVYELMNVGEEIIWETSKYTINTVKNQKYSTIVTINSEEISNVLYQKTEPSTKPYFPEQPFSYFYLAKKVSNNVNWEIENFKDLIADVLFGIIWIIAVIVDVILIVIFFFLRLIWWLILLIGYLTGINEALSGII